MKKGARIAIAVISVFLTAIVIAACVCASIAGRINDDALPSPELSSWQSMIKDDTLLKKVVMPGAHDAGTAGMAWFSETQDRDIGEQLACGTRYFDLRVKEKKGECRIYHGPAYSLYLKDILCDVRDFLNANPTECVILDVHKFGNAGAKPRTVELLDEYLGGMFVTKPADVSELDFVGALTLGDVRGKCLLIWGDNDEYAAQGNHYFLRNDDHGDVETGCLQSFYERSWNWYYSSEKYIKKAIPAYINKYKQSIGGLFVLQAQLTDGCLVIGPRYREGCHESNMNACVLAMGESEDLDCINIVMRDFICPEKNCCTLKLNLDKHIVKDGCAAAYEAMVEEFLR